MRAHRYYFLVLSTAVFLGLWSVPALAVQATNVAVSKVTSTSAVVVVKTDITSDVIIDYGSASGVYSASRTGSALGRHQVLLDGMAPSSTVYYRVTVTASGNPVDSLTLAEAGFSTAKAPGVPFSFGVVGDNRPPWTSPIAQPAVWQTIVGQMSAENIDFVLHSGDIIYGATSDTAGQNEEKYDVFFGITSLLTAGTPLYTVPGNHERLESPTNRQGYEREFTLPVNNGVDAATDGEEYYSLDYGDTHFIFLCTELPGESPLIINNQKAWLEADLAASSKPWKVVILHRPLFSQGHPADPWIDPADISGRNNRDAIHGLFKQYGVDVVFQGHDHFYLHQVRDGIQYVVSGGGGSPLYDLPAFGPGDIYGARAYHHVKVDETAGSLSINAIDAAGVTLESFTLGMPSLSLAQTGIYWKNMADYLAGILSVDYSLGNTGNGDLATLDIVYLGASDGVSPITAVPVSLGGLPVGQSVPLTLQYLIPAGTGFFSSSTFVICTDLAGGSYAFPGPAPTP